MKPSTEGRSRIACDGSDEDEDEYKDVSGVDEVKAILVSL